MSNKTITLILVILFTSGCSSSINKKVDFPFETLEIISTPKNTTMSVVVIKTGIASGATVPFEYNFYFSKDDNILDKSKLFLSVRGLETYKINWTSVNTIDVDINASRIIMFKSDVLLQGNTISDLYYVNHFSRSHSTLNNDR